MNPEKNLAGLKFKWYWLERSGVTTRIRQKSRILRQRGSKSQGLRHATIRIPWWPGTWVNPGVIRSWDRKT